MQLKSLLPFFNYMSEHILSGNNKETVFGGRNEFFYNLSSINLPMMRFCVISKLLLSMMSIKYDWRSSKFHVDHFSVN